MMRTRLPVFAFFAILFVGVSFFFLSGEARSETAPGWSLPDLNGKMVKLSDFKGKVVVLNFWATYCPPCIAEIPDFIEVQKEFRGQPVAIIGVSLDSVQPSEVAAFVKKQDINYTILIGTEEVGDKYSPNSIIPVTFIIKPDGKVADKQEGAVSKAYLESHIKELLPSATVK